MPGSAAAPGFCKQRHTPGKANMRLMHTVWCAEACRWPLLYVATAVCGHSHCVERLNVASVVQAHVRHLAQQL
jgi:hypothetical protein